MSSCLAFACLVPLGAAMLAVGWWLLRDEDKPRGRKTMLRPPVESPSPPSEEPMRREVPAPVIAG